MPNCSVEIFINNIRLQKKRLFSKFIAFLGVSSDFKSSSDRVDKSAAILDMVGTSCYKCI